MDFTNLQVRQTKTPAACNENNYCGTHYLIYTDEKGLHRPFEARMYCTRTGTVYCRMWLHLGKQWAYGVGNAGGWGYDKMSTALLDAMQRAGVSFDQDEYFNGHGMETAMQVIQRALESCMGITLYPLHSFA